MKTCEIIKYSCSKTKRQQTDEFFETKNIHFIENEKKKNLKIA